MKSCLYLVCALCFLAGCAGGGANSRAASPSQDAARDGPQKCTGGSFDRNFCAQLANRRCGGGYEVFEMDAREEDGVTRRAYYFKCTS